MQHRRAPPDTIDDEDEPPPLVTDSDGSDGDSMPDLHSDSDSDSYSDNNQQPAQHPATATGGRDPKFKAEQDPKVSLF